MSRLQRTRVARISLSQAVDLQQLCESPELVAEKMIPLERMTVGLGSWKIKDEIRGMVNFKKLNLMQPFTSLGKFDIIFCRNVAIYFTLEDRKKLFNKLADSLAVEAFLRHDVGDDPGRGRERHARADRGVGLAQRLRFARNIKGLPHFAR